MWIRSRRELTSEGRECVGHRERRVLLAHCLELHARRVARRSLDPDRLGHALDESGGRNAGRRLLTCRDCWLSLLRGHGKLADLYVSKALCRMSHATIFPLARVVLRGL